MLRILRKAYGAGWRAGRAPAVLIRHADGTKTLARPACPYQGKWVVLLRWSWETGWHSGMMRKLSTTKRNF